MEETIQAEQPQTTPVKITFMAIPEAVEAMHTGAKINNHTCTDTINRALQLYSTLEQARAAGYQIVLRGHGKDTPLHY